MYEIITEIRKSKEIPKEKKEQLIEIYNKYRQGENVEKLGEEIDEILRDIYLVPKDYEDPADFKIPISFINSNLGKAILRIKLDVDIDLKNTYTGVECAILANKSKQMIGLSFKDGQLKGRKMGARRLLVDEEDILDYMINNGRNPFEYHDAKERIERYKALKKDGHTLREIASDMCQTKIFYD